MSPGWWFKYKGVLWCGYELTFDRVSRKRRIVSQAASQYIFKNSSHLFERLRLVNQSRMRIENSSFFIVSPAADYCLHCYRPPIVADVSLTSLYISFNWTFLTCGSPHVLCVEMTRANHYISLHCGTMQLWIQFNSDCAPRCPLLFILHQILRLDTILPAR